MNNLTQNGPEVFTPCALDPRPLPLSQGVVTTQPDLIHAGEFLARLDPTTPAHTFQTFDDSKERKRGDLARILHGTLEQHVDELVRLSAQGAGIFVSVNTTNGHGRQSANIIRKRAIYQEADKPGARLPLLEPHITVESSPGNFHRYWLISAYADPTDDDWNDVMRRMVADYDSDPNAKDLARVLRLPGFLHQKNPGRPTMVRMIKSSSDAPYQWDKITAAIPPLQREVKDYRNVKGKGIDCPNRLKSAMAAIDPDCDYNEWNRVGMALHHADDGGGEGFDLWDEWSSRGSKYLSGECADKWESFGTYPGQNATLGTVFHLAKDSGWNWQAERHGYIDEAKEVIAAAIELCNEDPLAYLEPAVIEAFEIIKAEEPIAFERSRSDLKKSNKSIRIGALDDLVGKIMDDGDDRASLSSRLADLAESRCELWHDADGKTFASFDRQIADEPLHRDHCAIESTSFREFIAWLAHSELGAAPSSDALKSCQNTLAGKAKFDGEQFATARRIAKDETGYWLDIGDEARGAILITAAGWRTVTRPPVRFLRTKAMRPLPMPISDGDIDSLWSLVNVPDEERIFVLAWILESLRAGTPFPVLELVGEQGTAKSTTQKVIRRFVDPNKAMLRPAPKTREDIFIAAGNNHVISLENMSGLSPEYSDALCTIATGGGMAGRQLYSNDEENIIEAHNPVILNGIGAIITRPDLLDRAIVICPPVIDERMTEAEHSALLERNAPSIMGGILDLLSRTLAELPNVRIARDRLPRMADFAYLGEAMHRAMGGEPGQFLDRYIHHRRDSIQRTISASPVAAACIRFIESGQSFAGPVGQLLDKLSSIRCQQENGDFWPKSSKGMGDSFRRVAPPLRQLGIDASIESKHRRDGVHCTLKRGTYEIEPPPFQSLTNRSQSSQCSPATPATSIPLPKWML
jgi:hypothetical protein